MPSGTPLKFILGACLELMVLSASASDKLPIDALYPLNQAQGMVTSIEDPEWYRDQPVDPQREWDGISFLREQPSPASARVAALKLGANRLPSILPQPLWRDPQVNLVECQYGDCFNRILPYPDERWLLDPEDQWQVTTISASHWVEQPVASAAPTKRWIPEPYTIRGWRGAVFRSWDRPNYDYDCIVINCSWVIPIEQSDVEEMWDSLKLEFGRTVSSKFPRPFSGLEIDPWLIPSAN